MPPQTSFAAQLGRFEQALTDAKLPTGYWESRWDFLKTTDELVLQENILLAFFIPEKKLLPIKAAAALEKVVGKEGVLLAENARSFVDDLPRLSRFLGEASPEHPLAEAASLALLSIAYAVHERRVELRLIRRYRAVWVSIADLCGRWRLRYVLEDAIFACLQPDRYTLVLSIVKRRDKKYTHLLDEAITIVQHRAEKEGLKNIDIYARRKNIYGIYAKMQGGNKTVNQIRDIFGIRVLVRTNSDCYKILEIIHRLWPAYPEYLRDFIKLPKPNGYQSIHTTVCCLEGQDVEFQIRTQKMHEVAQFGVACHSEYKKSNRLTV